MSAFQRRRHLNIRKVEAVKSAFGITDNNDIDVPLHQFITKHGGVEKTIAELSDRVDLLSRGRVNGSRAELFVKLTANNFSSSAVFAVEALQSAPRLSADNPSNIATAIMLLQRHGVHHGRSVISSCSSADELHNLLWDKMHVQTSAQGFTADEDAESSDDYSGGSESV